jgi:apolipoprotein N-acyltransferase
MSRALVQRHVESVCIPRSNPFLWIWGLLAAIVSGAAMAACFAPVDLHYLAWVALVPFLVVLPRMTPDQAWLYGLVVGLGYYGVALAWVYELSHLFGGIFLFEFALLLGLGFRVARMLMGRFGTAAMVWAVPLAFTGQEVLRSEGLGRLRFAFGAWGYSQAHNSWIAQIASIGGVYFVSFLLVLVSASIAYGLISRSRRGWWPAGMSIAAVLVLGAAAQPRDYSSLRRVPVACVQGEHLGYPQYAKMVAEALCDPARPKFVVMPEHSLVGLFADQDPAIDLLAGLAKEHGAYVCAAGDTRQASGSACPFDNVAWLVGPDGEIVARQLKAVPIPFFRDGNPARVQEVAPTPYGRVGIYVCYDGTFTDVPRRLVGLGAEVLLAPVMDVEDWPAQERRQHADLAIFRAIELRRCVVRAASSGISQVIDATGRVTGMRTKEQGAGVLRGSVYFNRERTAFVRGGYLFAPIAGILLVAAAAVLTGMDLHGKAICRLRGRRESMTADPIGLLSECGAAGGP